MIYQNRKMKVDVLYSRDIKIINGINKIICEFIENKTIFLDQEIDLEYPFSLELTKEVREEKIKNKKIEVNKFFLKAILKLKEVKKFSLLRGMNYFLRGILINKKYKKLRRKPDLIIFNDIFSMFFFRGDCKKILVIHSVGDYMEAFDGLNLPNFLLKIINKVYMKCLVESDLVIFLSKKMAEKYSEDGVVGTYIYNGIDKKKIEFKKTFHDKLKVIIIGNICERKGHKLLYEALIELKNEGLNLSKLEINCFGNKTGLGEILEKELKKNELDNVLKIKGLSTEVEYELSNSDIFFMPSLSEGLPIAILEAAKYGLPIVTTDVGSIKEVFGDSVHIFKPNSKEEIKKQIKKMLNGDFKGIGKESEKIFFDNLTSEKMIESYTRCIKGILKES